jgi:tRNA(Ile)-lysidine synthase
MKLHDALVRYIHCHHTFFKPTSRILVACSGGPDSVALVRGLKALQLEWNCAFAIGHINHQLRGRASQQDEVFVKNLADDLNWPVFTNKERVLKSQPGNLEEAARRKRYQGLAEMAKRFKSRIVLTAHNLDDQIETILMNLIRGTGPSGLGGMSPLRPIEGTKIWLGRPLLDISKKELIRELGVKKWRYREDKSNQNTNFFRNWLRHEVVPMLEQRGNGFKGRLAKMASLLREDDVFWESQMKEMAAQLMARRRNGFVIDFERLLSYPVSHQRRFLRRACGGNLLSFDGVDRLRNWMLMPPTQGRIWQLRKGWVAERLSKSKGSPSTKLFWMKQTTQKTAK